MNFSEIREWVRERRVRLAVYVLDNCRDNPFLEYDELAAESKRSLDRRPRSVGMRRGISRPPEKQGDFIFYSAKQGEMANDRLREDDTNSPFTTEFLKEFQPRVPLEVVANNIEASVLEKTSGTRLPQKPAYVDGFDSWTCIEEGIKCDGGKILQKEVLKVRSGGGGDYKTILEAVAAAAAAKDDTRIEIYPGEYHGRIEVTMPLELVGVGNRDDIVWETEAENLIEWKAASGLIQNLTLRQAGEHGDDSYGVIVFDGGSARFEGNSASAEDAAVIRLRNGADPTIHDNRITSESWNGVKIALESAGTITGNLIEAGSIGIVVSGGSKPTIADNRIVGASHGIVLDSGAAAIVSENEIVDSLFEGIRVSGPGDPIIHENRIARSDGWGVYLEENSRAQVTDNNLRGNRLGGVRAPAGTNDIVLERNAE